MNLKMLREAQGRKKSANPNLKLLTKFMDWLQENEHINKSEEYRKELCEMFLNSRESEDTE